jgi:phage-related protein
MALHILQDHISLAKKVLLGLFITMLIIMPEDVLDMVVTTLHYAFEGFEFLLEEVVQHVFHMDKTESQVYVFYLLIGSGVGLVFLIVKITPLVVRSIGQTIQTSWLNLQNSVTSFWDRKSIFQKVLLIVLYLPFSLYLLSFMIM